MVRPVKCTSEGEPPSSSKLEKSCTACIVRRSIVRAPTARKKSELKLVAGGVFAGYIGFLNELWVVRRPKWGIHVG